MVFCIFAALLSQVLLYISLPGIANPKWGNYFYNTSDRKDYSAARVSMEYP